MTGDGSLSVEVHGEAALAYVMGLRERLHSNLLRVVTALSIRLQSLVKDKLSGPVLHTRTGTLRRSINRVVLDQSEQIVAQVGTNIAYAHPHEFGFDGVVDVRAYTRRVFASGAENPRAAARKRRKVVGTTEVRAHARHMHMPERSFLRSSLKDMTADIEAEIKQGAREAFK